MSGSTSSITSSACERGDDCARPGTCHRQTTRTAARQSRSRCDARRGLAYCCAPYRLPVVLIRREAVDQSHERGSKGLVIMRQSGNRYWDRWADTVGTGRSAATDPCNETVCRPIADGLQTARSTVAALAAIGGPVARSNVLIGGICDADSALADNVRGRWCSDGGSERMSAVAHHVGRIGPGHIRLDKHRLQRNPPANDVLAGFRRRNPALFLSAQFPGCYRSFSRGVRDCRRQPVESRRNDHLCGRMSWKLRQHRNVWKRY